MTDLKLCVDLVDFELMHITVVMQVLDKSNDDNERLITDFSRFQETNNGIRMTLTEANAFLKALSLSPGIEITTPFKESKNEEKFNQHIPRQNNEPQHTPMAAPAQAGSAYAPFTSSAPAASVVPAPSTTPAPHFNQATAAATPPQEEIPTGIPERFSTGAAE